jgi:hypothetical protein
MELRQIASPAHGEYTVRSSMEPTNNEKEFL